MTRFQIWLLHVSNVLVGGTGLVYAYMRYLAKSDDVFSVLNHPLQDDFQHLHVVFAPLLVFAVGYIWQKHVLAGLQRNVPKKRNSGIEMMITLFPMVFSGYLIQVSVEAQWRDAWVAMHLVTSGLWIVGYVAHVVARWSLAKG